MVAGYVAATAQVEGENPLIASAAAIAYDREEAEELAEAMEMPPIPTEPKKGSFERLKQGFGGGPGGQRR